MVKYLLVYLFRNQANNHQKIDPDIVLLPDTASSSVKFKIFETRSIIKYNIPLNGEMPMEN